MGIVSPLNPQWQAIKLAALVAVPILFLAVGAYVYLHSVFRCEPIAREKFSQIILDNSGPYQNDLDISTGQKGAGRRFIQASVVFKQFVSYLAERACTCVEKKIKSSNVTLRELALQVCIAEVRSNPYP